MIDSIQPPQHPRRVFLFGSPKSGSGRGREQLSILREKLQSHSVDLTSSSDVSDLDDFLAASHLEQDQVIAAGGDGTIALYIERLQISGVSTAGQPTLTIFPLGTENLLSRYFSFQRDPQELVRTMLAGDDVWIDLGVTIDAQNKRVPFTCMATAGFDATVVRRVHMNRKGHISRWTYIPAAARVAAARRGSMLEIVAQVQTADGKEIEERWSAANAMVFNTPMYAGWLSIEPNANPGDGFLDLVIFPNGSVLSTARYLFGIWLSSVWKPIGKRVLADVIRRRVSSTRLVCPEEMSWQSDGDYRGQLPISIQLEQRKLRMRVPCK
ncbi:MAG: diacylglycerol kinase family protein [Planctomycetota bacterium]